MAGGGVSLCQWGIQSMNAKGVFPEATVQSISITGERNQCRATRVTFKEDLECLVTLLYDTHRNNNNDNRMARNLTHYETHI